MCLSVSCIFSVNSPSPVVHDAGGETGQQASMKASKRTAEVTDLPALLYPVRLWNLFTFSLRDLLQRRLDTPRPI
jgi:hypothetical protein